MPQIDFFFNKREQEDFVKKLLVENFTLVRDQNLTDPSFPKINTFAQYILNQTVYNEIYFLTNPIYTETELCYGSFFKEGSKFYYIQQRSGGPTIDYFEGRIGTESHPKGICGSNLSHYKSYFSCDSKSEIIAKASLKSVYKSLADYIKSKSVKISTTARTYYVGLDTIRHLKDGWRLVNLDQKYYEHLIV